MSANVNQASAHLPRSVDLTWRRPQQQRVRLRSSRERDVGQFCLSGDHLKSVHEVGNDL
jgi:hypothetical protein